MRWVTRRNAHVDRTACPWLIRRFIDRDAEFAFVPAETDPATIDGRSFDMRGAEFGHEGPKCTFEVMVERRGLGGDRALVEMGRIIRDADVPPSRIRRAEGPGLDALIRGFQLTTADDQEKLRLTAPLYDALYAYCRAKVAEPPPKQGAPRPRLRYARRVAEHLEADDAHSARSGGDATMETGTVLFLCPHNAAKSVLAAVDFDRMARARGLNYQAASAGTEPDAQPSPAVVAALRAEGIDVSDHRPRAVTRRDLATARRVISLGCDLSDLAPPNVRMERWDDVPPTSRDLEATRAAIRRRVAALVDELERGERKRRGRRKGGSDMQWVTRARPKVDRIACPWLIARFVDPEAEFLYVPAEEVMAVAERTSAIPFDVPGVELGHHGPECSFDAILKKYDLTDPALHGLARIVRGADTPAKDLTPESPGLEAIAEGFRLLFQDDQAQLGAESIVYDALYAYCQQSVTGAR